MIHVDDILFVGLKSFWNNVFLKKRKERFSVSHDELKGPGSSITFLRRKIMEVGDGLVLALGTTVDKVVSLFERMFGTARSQKVPCDASIQFSKTFRERLQGISLSCGSMSVCRP